MKKNKYVNLAKKIVLGCIDKEKYSVFLFGSRAQNLECFSSDIDIGVIGEEPLGNIYYKIINELEKSIIPYKIELVDFSQVGDNFKNTVLNDKIVLWNKNSFFIKKLSSTKKP